MSPQPDFPVRGTRRRSVAEKTAIRRSVATSCEDALAFIDADGTGDLDEVEVMTLLAVMSVRGQDATNVMSYLFRRVKQTSMEAVVDAIIEFTDIDENCMQVMFARVATFQKAFQNLDTSGDGTLDLEEICTMLERINVSTSLAAELLAYLDDDDSGQVSWCEFVQGVCREDFQARFPEISVEAIIQMPSCLDNKKNVSYEEEQAAIRSLPAVEYAVYWMLTKFFGRPQSPKSETTPETSTAPQAPMQEPQVLPRDVGKAPKPPDISEGRSSMATSQKSEVQLSLPNMGVSFAPCKVWRQNLEGQPYMVTSAQDKGVMVVTRKSAKDPDKVVKPVCVQEKQLSIVTRLQPKNPGKVHRAVVSSLCKSKKMYPDSGHHFNMTTGSLPYMAWSPNGRAAIEVEPWQETKDNAVFASTWQGPLKDDNPIITSLGGSKEEGSPMGHSWTMADYRNQDGELIRSKEASSEDSPRSVQPQETELRVGTPWSKASSDFARNSNERRSKKVEKRRANEMCGAATSMMKSMHVEEKKAHLLTEKKRRLMWTTIYAAVLAAAIAGVVAALFAKVLNDWTATIVDEEEEYVAFFAISCSLSVIWSLVEMVICCIAALIATAKMAHICGLILVPMDRERAVLAGCLARAALELGHPQSRLFGIDPLKRVSKVILCLNTLMYMGSRGMTKFLIRLLVKKVGPRSVVKFAEFAPLVSEIAVNVLFNVLTVRAAMNEVMICTIGPSASIEVTSQLIKARHTREQDKRNPQPLNDLVKWQALRAIGIGITFKKTLHPNCRFLLQHVGNLFADENLIKRAKEAQVVIPDFSEEKDPSKYLQISERSSSKDERGCCSCCFGKKVAPERPRTPVSEKGKFNVARELEKARSLDKEEMFMEYLPDLSPNDALFVCSLLCLALILDGRIGWNDKRLLKRACAACNPPLQLHWPNVLRCVRLFVEGRPMPAEIFHACFEGSDTEGSICDKISSCLRWCTDCCNIF
eukprot:gb/GFBE01055861.1/.p1 GENE.gb/GFBE01055861.1/~~gb/GFBE01055861.1/.p1  ORF type:complete len:983 (+),score=211.03 gb/GFBE01055861.1/:1-2949(+)